MASEVKPGVIDFNGKQYTMVRMRMQSFREDCPLKDGWGIRTELLNMDKASVCYRAEVVSPSGLVVATGHKTISNRKDAPEKCETQAVGRALSFAGYGGEDMDICSADDMLEAFWSEDDSARFWMRLGQLGVTYQDFLRFVEDRKLREKGFMPWQITGEERLRLTNMLVDMMDVKVEANGH
tara:strand:- start:6925 stop:7467 length:543 start_codon:yes stop_codon:yes gene_type:complete